MTDQDLLPPDRAISLLHAQLAEPVENQRHDSAEAEAWERVTLSIVEQTFGEHSRNAKNFAVTLSYARQSEDQKQAWHVQHIKEKKVLLRAFIKELEIIPHQHSQPSDDRFARIAVDEARKSKAEDDRVHPKVGCVVVKEGRVLAKAHRGELEGNHAEFAAIEKKLGGETLTGCTVYATLEPCTTRNHPKVPCADRLIERRVARVVIGILDPNPGICGKGMSRLQRAGIAVDVFPAALVEELLELNRDFIRSFALSGTANEETQKGKARLAPTSLAQKANPAMNASQVVNANPIIHASPKIEIHTHAAQPKPAAQISRPTPSANYNVQFSGVRRIATDLEREVFDGNGTIGVKACFLNRTVPGRKVNDFDSATARIVVKDSSGREVAETDRPKWLNRNTNQFVDIRANSAECILLAFRVDENSWCMPCLVQPPPNYWDDGSSHLLIDGQPLPNGELNFEITLASGDGFGLPTVTARLTLRQDGCVEIR